MSGLVILFASMMCLLVILTGPSSALHGWQLPAPVLPTYPSNPNDPYYQAFQTVPPLDVTAKKLITNFLDYSLSARITKRQVSFLDTVIVLDGSGSVSRCAFSKAKEGLKHLIRTPFRSGTVNARYAAVTFSNTATVNFNFSPVLSASRQITTIAYPGGGTNTQAGLREAKNLFDDPFSGRRNAATKRVILVTDGRSNIDPQFTIPNANALRASGVEIFVVAVGNSIRGIDEMVRIATDPNSNLLRVQDFGGFVQLVDLVVRTVSPPGTYQFVNYSPPCN